MKTLLLSLLVMTSASTSFAAGAGQCETLFSAYGESPSPLFRGNTIAQLELSGDFNKIHQVAIGADLTGASRNSPEFYTSAVLRDLTEPNVSFAAQMRARGMSSLGESEASFPKLKIEIEKTQDLDGKIFKKARSFRINTHVATNPKDLHTEMGRLNNENSPLRESLLYSMANQLELLTPANRLARIHYIDTVAKTDFTRNALIIETDKSASERLQMEQADASDFYSSEKSGIDPVLGAKFHMFHMLIGNADVGLRVNEGPVVGTEKYRPLFNVVIFKNAKGEIVPMVYDLDLSSLITGLDNIPDNAYINKNFNYNSSKQYIVVENFLSLRQRFSEAQLQAALLHFKSHKLDLYQTVRTATVDEIGRKAALERLDIFFSSVDAAMKIPMIASDGVRFYKDAAKSADKVKMDNMNEVPGILRPGTPVVVLGKEGGMLKIAIMNVNRDLLPGESVIGYIDANTVIAPTLPENLIGKVDTRDMFW